MSREKKSKVDDLTKLRKILDNSSDPTLNVLLTKDDKALESIRRRLHGCSPTTHLASNGFFLRYASMEPRVIIYEKRPTSPPYSMSLEPRVDSPVPLPEFELVSLSSPSKQTTQPSEIFDTEDLFEIEKVEQKVPEFIEITPKQPTQSLQQKEHTMDYNEPSIQESSLPEWQPVADEENKTIQESFEQQKNEITPEFEQITISPASEPMEEESPLQKEEPNETPVDFLAVESSQFSYQMLTRQQIRGLKRTQRKKEKEAKKLQRIEQKRLKKERQQRQREEKNRIQQQPSSLIPSEKHSEHLDTFEPVESPEKKVYMQEFKGIECIDEKTAELLYKNGYFSIDNIKDATIDDLVQIRGLKRKLAKQIKKEIAQKVTLPESDEFVPMKQMVAKKKSPKKLKDTAEWESYPSRKKMPKQPSIEICTYKQFTLYKKEPRSNDRKKTTIHFFSKERPPNGQPAQLPEGYHIAVNKKTGIPYLKKKR